MFDLEENVVQEIQKQTDAEYTNLAEKDSETTTNKQTDTSTDYSIRVDNFQVENTADANITGPLNFKPKTMYHNMAEGSENLKDSSETTIIPWIQPKGFNKDYIGKMPQKLLGLLYLFVYYIRHIWFFNMLSPL